MLGKIYSGCSFLVPAFLLFEDTIIGLCAFDTDIGRFFLGFVALARNIYRFGCVDRSIVGPGVRVATSHHYFWSLAADLRFGVPRCDHLYFNFIFALGLAFLGRIRIP